MAAPDTAGAVKEKLGEEGIPVKRNVALLVFLALVMSCFAAPALGEGEQIELTFALGQESGPTFELFEEMGEAYTKLNPNVKVDIMGIVQDYSTKILTMNAAGNAPDLFWIFPNMVPEYVKQNAIVDLTPYDGTLYDSSDILDSYKPDYTVDGHLYALPGDGAFNVLFTNDDLFKKAGVEVPTTDLTWAELKETAAKMTVVENGKTIQYGYSVPSDANGVYGYIIQNGGDIVDETGKVSTWNTPAVIETLEYLKSFVDEGIAPSPSDTSAVSPAELFKSGNQAMIYDGVYMCSLGWAASDVNYNIAGLTYNTDKKVLGTSGACSVATSSKNVEEAVKLLCWFNGAEGQKLKFSGMYAGTPSLKSLMDTEYAYKGFIDPNHPEVKLEKLAELGQYQVATSPVFSNAQITDEINSILSLYFIGDIDVNTCVADIDAAVTPLLG